MQLCEDCYMDLLSPMKSCDPWAVHSARISMNQGRQALLPIQQQILDAVTAAGAMTVTDLSEALGIPPAELERQFATLRHMELLRGFKGDDGRKRLCPFDRP
jgi:predicted transcriptional regulator